MSPQPIYTNNRISLTLGQFLRRLQKDPDHSHKLVGPTVPGAARVLGVSRQRIYQLVEQRRLQMVELWNVPSEFYEDEFGRQSNMAYKFGELENGKTQVAIFSVGEFGEPDDIEHVFEEGDDSGFTNVGVMISNESLQKFMDSDRRPGRPKSDGD